MWLPENTYINICKLAQEIFKNHYKTGCKNTIEVGSRHKPMTCTYILDMPEELAKRASIILIVWSMMPFIPCKDVEKKGSPLPIFCALWHMTILSGCIIRRRNPRNVNCGCGNLWKNLWGQESPLSLKMR